MDGPIHLEFVEFKLVESTFFYKSARIFLCGKAKRVSLLQTHIPQRCPLAGKPSSTLGAQLSELMRAGPMAPACMTECPRFPGEALMRPDLPSFLVRAERSVTKDDEASKRSVSWTAAAAQRWRRPLPP